MLLPCTFINLFQAVSSANLLTSLVDYPSFQYKEYEEELSTAMTTSHAQTSDDADLEEELMGLLDQEEEEGSSQIGQPPTKKPAVSIASGVFTTRDCKKFKIVKGLK